MARALSAKTIAKNNEARFERIYRERCSGAQINIMKLGAVHKVGLTAIAEGLDDTAIGDRIVAYVETIRLN